MPVALRAPRLRDPNVIIRLSRDISEIQIANRLVCDSYIEKGYWDDDLPFRQNPHMHSDTRVVFVVERKGEIIGTASIVKDSRAGLPLDKTHAKVLKKFRHYGDRLAEVSALALTKNAPNQQNLVFFLFKFLMQYSFYYAHIDRFVIASTARHADFYKAVYCFEPLEGGDDYSYVKSHVIPTVSTLPLLQAHKIYHDRYEAELEEPADSFYRFMFVTEHPNLQFPDKRLMLRRRDIDWVSEAVAQELPIAV